MKCPDCGAEVDANASFCPKCGYIFDKRIIETNRKAESNINLKVPNDQPIPLAEDENFRERPEFKKGMLRTVICSVVGFVGGGLSLLGSLMINYFESMGRTRYPVGVTLLLVGLLVGLIMFFGFVIPAGKKLFGDHKTKGFYENIPGIMLGFGLSMIVIALAFQSFTLMVS